MKRILAVLTLTVFGLTAYTQYVPTPDFCAVSVDSASGKPHLFWTISDTSAIDGFIIKRVIWDGTGVVDGTLNNVAILPYPAMTDFIDTTTTYNTEARPDQRSERYVITAYKDTNSSVRYSGFSRRLSTIFLSARYDSCSGKVNLNWLAQDYDTFKVWQLTPVQKPLTVLIDTFFTYKPVGTGDFSFVVSAPTNNCITDSIGSNIARLRISFNQTPEKLEVLAINASFNDTIALFLNILIPDQNPPEVRLLRDNQTIATFTGDFRGIYYDNTSSGALHTYKLISVSICNSELLSSNNLDNILLTGQYNDLSTEKSVSLQWNAPTDSNFVYEVYFSTDKSSFQLLTNTTDTFYTHVLNPLIANTTLPPQLFYLVKTSTTDDSLANVSNILEINPPPLFFVPNTINPTSSNPRDRYFKIYADFTGNYEISIFDRYGNLLFQSSDPNILWDGRDRGGNLVPPGTYIYVISFTVRGKKYIKKGSIAVFY